MNLIIVILIWALATFAISVVAGILGKKFGLSYLIGSMAAFAIISIILANKIVSLGHFTFPAGVIAFSATYLISDIISEKWGRENAKKAACVGFFADLILMISIYFALIMPAALFTKSVSDSFAIALSATPRIVLASLLAYLISQKFNIFSYFFWMKITKGKYLWLRNGISTILSQLISSIIFITIAFYGTFPILAIIIDLWIIKISLALLDIPFFYAAIKLIDIISKKYEL